MSALAGRLRSLRGAVVTDAAWGSAFEVAILLSSLANFVILTRSLGLADYGYYAALAGLVSVLATMATSWVGFVLVQQVVRNGADVRQTVASLVSWLLIGVLGLSGLGVLLKLTALPRLPLGPTIAYIAAELVGNTTMSLSSSVRQAVQGYSASARARIVQEALQAAAITGLFAVGHVTLLATGLALLAANLVPGVVNLVVVGRDCHVSYRPGVPRWAHVRDGSLFAGVLLAFAVEEDADKTLLIRFAPASVAGAYAAAYRIVQIGLVPLRAIVGSMHNRFVAHDPDALGEHLGRSLRFSVPAVGYGVVVAAGLVASAPLLPFVLGHSYAAAVPMIRWLALLVLLRSAVVFAHNGLLGLGRIGFRTAVLAVPAAVNVTIDVVLIPVWSWRAAALATLVAEALFVAGTWAGLVTYQRRHDAAVLRRRTGAPGAPGIIPSLDTAV